MKLKIIVWRGGKGPAGQTNQNLTINFYYQVQVAVFSCMVELYQRQEQLNSVSMVFGKQSVTQTGTTRMHLWCAENWDCQLLVSNKN